MENVDPETHTLRIPGFPTILVEFGRPIAIFDTLSDRVGFAYQFGTLGSNNHVWGVRAELVNAAQSGIATSVVLTAKDVPTRVVPRDRVGLLGDTLTELAGNAPHDSRTARQQLFEQCRSEVDNQQGHSTELVIDGRAHEAIAKRCRNYVGVAAHYLDLIVVAVVPSEETERVRLGTISWAAAVTAG